MTPENFSTEVQFNLLKYIFLSTQYKIKIDYQKHYLEPPLQVSQISQTPINISLSLLLGKENRMSKRLLGTGKMRCHSTVSDRMKAHLWFILICISDLQCSASTFKKTHIELSSHVPAGLSRTFTPFLAKYKPSHIPSVTQKT